MFKHKTKMGAVILAMVTATALLSGCGADTAKEYDKHLKPETTVSVDKDADKVDEVDDKKDSKKETEKAGDKIADKQDSKDSAEKPADKDNGKKDDKPAESKPSKPANSGAVNKPSTSKPSNPAPAPSKPSKPAPSEPAKPSKPAPAPCSHSWKDQYKTVHHDAQYKTEPVYEDRIVYEDRPVYKWQAYWTCNECGKRFESAKDAGMHTVMICGGGYTAHEEKVQTGTEKVQVGTNKVQVGTKQVLVKDAWDEQVKTGSVCTKCNAHK